MTHYGRMALLVMVMSAAACRSQGKGSTVDTTKLVYRDDEAPKEQLYVVNGVPTVVPWAQVPESERWIIDWNDDGKTYKVRVPIVRIDVSSRDREGRPVPEKDGFDVGRTLHGLNPDRSMHVYYGSRH